MNASSTAYERYWAAVAVGNGASAAEVALAEIDAGRPVVDVLESLVAAAQAEVGRRWAGNEWNVAQEHRATSIGEDVVAAIAARAPAPGAGPVALLGCCDGEWHALPSRILAAALRHHGWRVTFLGASVPADHLGQLLHELGPDVTALSCALPTRLFEARRAIEVSRGAGVPVIVGGRGFGTDGRWAGVLGADAWAPDARSALELLAALPAFTSPAPALPDGAAESTALRARSGSVVAESVRRMTEYLPPEDVAHVVEFLAAARLVADPSLFTEFVQWLRDVLLARQVPATTLATGLRVIADVIADDAAAPAWVTGYLQAALGTLGEPAVSR